MFAFGVRRQFDRGPVPHVTLEGQLKKLIFVLWVATVVVLAMLLSHYMGEAKYYAPLTDAQSIDHYNHADNMTMLYLAVFIGVVLVGLAAVLLTTRRWFYPASPPPSRQAHWDAPVVAEPMSAFHAVEGGQPDEPQEAPKRYGFYDWAAPGVDPIAS